VASRWRIRHKLLLGVGLVVCLMALLLCGTLRGLWSYYLTTNAIRAKLDELDAVEELKAAVAELVSPDNAASLVRAPGRLAGELQKVRDRLDAYGEKLEETVNQGHDPGEGFYESEWIDRIGQDLDKLQKVVEARVAEPRAGGMLSDEEQKQQDLEKLAKPCATLRRDTLDLRNVIKKQLADRIGESRPNYQNALWIIVPSSIVGLVIMASLMRSFYGWVLNPIRDLEAGVGRVAHGDFEHAIELHSGDEMEDLAQAFNDMVQRLRDLYGDLARQVNERSRQLVRAERLASVGFLAAGVAHEINNPLASIAFCSEALDARLDGLLQHLRGRSAEEHEIFSKYLKMIQEEAFRCKTITERLLAFSRTGERRRERTDLRDLVQSVLNVTQHLPNHRDKHITFEVSADRPGAGIGAWVNGEEIKSVVLNLVVNALESMDEGGRLTIHLAQRGGMAELRFSDTGCGMTPEVLENIFEPFFTRSRTGKGTGLGLTISHLIISQHGGEIEAQSAGPGQGSTFLVRLPVQPPAESASEGEPPAPAAHRPVLGRAA
jgi:signal transduction histidine kinase